MWETRMHGEWYVLRFFVMFPRHVLMYPLISLLKASKRNFPWTALCTVMHE